MRKTTGSYRIYSIPGKTATLLPELRAVEDLPSAELGLGSCVCNKGPAPGQNTLMAYIYIYIYIYIYTGRFRTSVQKLKRA